jgi:hypothetical protein
MRNVLSAVLAVILVVSPVPSRRQEDPPEPWQITPATEVLGRDLVDLFRIENAWDCKGNAATCMQQEPDALVLTRVAFGESPSSLNDRIYVMWLIRLRAYLGYKEAGFHAGYRDIAGRWGPATTIKREAMCDGGCQFSPVRAAQNIYFPCFAKAGNLRSMLCPSDDELGDFYLTYLAAQQILAAPMTNFPIKLRGYDGFRSPSVAGVGRRYREGGLKSIQPWVGANVWMDESPDDNDFFRDMAARETK